MNRFLYSFEKAVQGILRSFFLFFEGKGKLIISSLIFFVSSSIVVQHTLVKSGHISLLDGILLASGITILLVLADWFRRYCQGWEFWQ